MPMHFCLIFLFWVAASDQTSIFVRRSLQHPTVPCLHVSPGCTQNLGAPTSAFLNEHVLHVDEINPAFTSRYSRQLIPMGVSTFQVVSRMFSIALCNKSTFLVEKAFACDKFQSDFFGTWTFADLRLFFFRVFWSMKNLFGRLSVCFLVGPYQPVGQLFYEKIAQSYFKAACWDDIMSTQYLYIS